MATSNYGMTWNPGVAQETSYKGIGTATQSGGAADVGTLGSRTSL